MARFPARVRDEDATLEDEIVLSCEIWMRNPTADISAHTLARLGVAPADAIFVDDAVENIEAARQLGITAHRFTNQVDAISAVTQFLN